MALGAALFVVAGREIGGEAAARIAAQVATGIGFLAGGVILRDGLQVRGLNTAATIWCVAGIGALTGWGLWGLAGTATLLLILANAMFHSLEHRLPQLRGIDERDMGHRRKTS